MPSSLFRVIPATALVIAFSAACASSGQVPDRADVGEELKKRTGSAIRSEPGAPSMPEGVSVDDGLTVDEAVSIALWNSPAFEATLAELGIARADVAEAGLLRNPVLSLLFPWGPKQLEWTLQFPAEMLWQRPRRVAMAAASARVVGERLVFDGLQLVADTRDAFVAAAAADTRLQLANENATVAQRIAGIADARLKAGDISELEARAARADAAQVRAAALAAEHDRRAARIALFARMGLDPPAQTLVITPAPPRSCPSVQALVEEAVSARPDVRAAEMAIEAAGLRAKWERSRILTLMASLDANAEGKEGYEIGPGLVAELPVLSHNQGAVSRAMAEMERASRAYLALRTQVTADVRAAYVRLEQSRQASDIWSKEILPELEIEQRQAERAYEAGEVALISLLDVGRRVVQARVRAMEAGIELQRAIVAIERSAGRSCQ